jgi:hypothetical protein
MYRYLRQLRITMHADRIETRPGAALDWGKGARHFRCVFERERGPGRDPLELWTFFTQGSGHKKDPTAAEVLDCIAMDASGVANAENFEAWASELGLDADSRKAEATYNAIVAQAKLLRDFLRSARSFSLVSPRDMRKPTSAFDTLLFHVERL